MVGRLEEIVIDCPEPRSLAGFYSRLLNIPVDYESDDWVTIEREGHVTLAFQRAPELEPPQWPDPATPQRLHLDVHVDDIDVGEREVLALGAKRLPGSGRDFRVYADPIGHPFCLVFDPDV